MVKAKGFEPSISGLEDRRVAPLHHALMAEVPGNDPGISESESDGLPVSLDPSD